LILHSKILPGSISTDEQVLSFAKREADDTALRRILDQEKRLYQNRQLAKTFDLERLIKIFSDHLDYVPGKKLPNVHDVIASTKKMVEALEAQQKIAIRFQEQILSLLGEDHQEKLKERVTKAIAYFSNSLTKDLLTPLDEHIKALKGVKKVSKYLKRVKQIRTSVVKQINSIVHVHYGGVKFDPFPVGIEITEETQPERGKKLPKGASLNETLILFRSGLKAAEIAERRNLALGTIESHIALLIKSGDVAIADCIEENRLNEILTAIRGSSEMSMQLVKQKLGDAVSYGEIRAVINHLQYLEKQAI
jgi:hypothetical protein